MISNTHLDELNDSLQLLRELNFGTDDAALWLDFEANTAEEWSIYLVHTPVSAWSNELIAQGVTIAMLERVLNELEEAQATGVGAFYIEGLRRATETVERALLGKPFGIGDQLHLDLEAHFQDPKGQTYYLLIDSSIDESEQSNIVAGFLTINEFRMFIKVMRYNPAHVPALIEEARDEYQEALALGWGDYPSGEKRRRRLRAARAASAANHPASKGRMKRPTMPAVASLRSGK